MYNIFLNFHDGEYLAEKPKIISVSMKENHKSLHFCLAVDRYKSDMNFRGYVWQSLVEISTVSEDNFFSIMRQQTS